MSLEEKHVIIHAKDKTISLFEKNFEELLV